MPRRKYTNYDGSGYSVAIIDSGYDRLHDNRSMIADYDFVSNDGNAYSNSIKSHGGQVASVVREYAPDVNIIHLRALDQNQDGWGFDRDIEDAMQWCITNAVRYNITCVNMSLGGNNIGFSNRTGVFTDEINTLYSMGIATVIAAGNHGRYGVPSPAKDSANAIVVGSVDARGSLSHFSNYHPNLVDIYALGTATPIRTISGDVNNISGTSFASPQVAGAFAALQEASVNLTGRKIGPDEFLRLANAAGDNGSRIYGDKIINVDRLIERFVESRLPSNPDIPTVLAGFDEAFYLANNPDVFRAMASGSLSSAIEHFNASGWREHRDPNEFFDVSYYLQNNTDVLRAGLNPLYHYLDHGINEARNPSELFNTNFYTASNLDVVRSGMNPFEHFRLFGNAEGRAGTPADRSTNRPDDYSADISTTGRINPGGGVIGNLETAIDLDWFAVTLVSGTKYIINLEGFSTNLSRLEDPLLRLHDSNGRLILSNDDIVPGIQRNSRLEFTADYTDTFFLSAGAWSDPGRALFFAGTYKLSVSRGEILDDFGSTPTNSGTIVIGESKTGNIERNLDQDWFSIRLEIDKKYEINLNGSQTDDGTLIDPFLRVFDKNGIQIAFNDDIVSEVQRNSELLFEPTSTDDYFISAGAWVDPTGRQELTGTYTVTVAQQDDFSSNLSTVGVVTPGTNKNGTIEISGDKDWFRVPVLSGAEYTIDLTGSSSNLGRLSDPVLSIYSANQTLVAFGDNSGSGLDASLSYIATYNGFIYIEAAGHNSNIGAYDISVSPAVIVDDFPNNHSTRGNIGLGSDLQGILETPGDSDWLRINLNADQTYQMRVDGVWNGAGTLFDPAAQVIDGSGNVLASDSNSGLGQNALINFISPMDGDYYLEVLGGGGSTGTYTAYLDLL